MECPSCGTRADAGDRFCSACGTELAAARTDQDPGDGPAARRADPAGAGVEPGASEAGETTGAEPGADDRPTDPAPAEDSPEEPGAPRSGDAGRRSDDADGDDPPERRTASEPSDAAGDGWDDAAAEEELESWQKRCPECEAVLVSQAVRCTDCGARQPDVDAPEGEDGGGTPRDGESRRPESGEPRPREPRESSYRERPRRERPRESDRPPREGTDERGRTTDAGGGEVQYERERRAAPDVEEQRERPSSYRERPPREERPSRAERPPGERRPPREQRPREEPPRRASDDRERAERLSERQASRRADDDQPYEPAVPSSRWWAGVLVPAVLTFLGAAIGVAADPAALAAGTVPWIGDGAGLLELGVVLTPTLAPFALYFDRRYVAHETGHTPSAAYVLVAVPYVNLVVTALYLWWRQQWLGRA